MRMQPPEGRGLLLILSVGALAAIGQEAVAAEFEEAQRLFLQGAYERCIELAEPEIGRYIRDERWPLLKLQAEMTLGRYNDARTTLEEALQRYPFSVAFPVLGDRVLKFTGSSTTARSRLASFERTLLNFPERYLTSSNRVWLGRFFLLRNQDARFVLDQFFDPATENRPNDPDPYYATAELALEKSDFALALETLRKAPERTLDDPEFHYLMARSLSESDRVRATVALNKALELNPRHLGSLLLAADYAIDSEQFDEAEDLLKRVLEVNPREPEAHAFRAVIAHLQGDFEGETEARALALAPWSENPEVDSLIGRELSQKYRFREGATYQEQSLAFDPDYLPARIQLCQDLLRLGEEDQGWRLAEAIHDRDGYNVEAFNLLTLRDTLDRYETLEADGLVVRMDPEEAELYGDRVLALLLEARATLGSKYDVQIDQPILVEIFERRDDFAVRTFGLPGAEGFLGVCFGPVITANSPASQGESPSNWESVLWHEYCHTITLAKTNNKMPRWLSEGISVFEEFQARPSWGPWFRPEYRQFILGEALTPLSELSAAFLAPESGLHLQFAYFESALAVEFLINRAGFEGLNGLLDDLGQSVPINEAIVRQTGTPIDELDRDFERFIRDRALTIAPEATWEDPELPPNADADAIADWRSNHPKSIWGLQRHAVQLIEEGREAEAEPILGRFKELYPEFVGPENPYELLAAIYRSLGDSVREREELEALIERSGDQSRALLRLIELDEEEGNEEALYRHADLLLAINPLIPAPHRALASASEALEILDQAELSYRALLRLDDTNPAELHYRLASVLKRQERWSESRREVLKALEEAPRFRDAHRLLLELVEQESAGSTSP